jgi:hypothetical protein
LNENHARRPRVRNDPHLLADTVIGFRNIRSRSAIHPARSNEAVRGPERRTPVKLGP